jgi:hypothetical protein
MTFQSELLNPQPALCSRRQLLQRAGLGCGSLALTWLLQQEGLLQAAADPLAKKESHFPAKAKSVIWLFMTGAPSQMDTFDYKPELEKRDGQPLPGADAQIGFFGTSAKCLKSPFKWKQYGETGAWVSELFPHTAQHVDDLAFIHSCYTTANNHAPASMQLCSGMAKPGYPSLGSWLTYGLGSQNQSLPAYVVMHNSKPRGDDAIWSSGFMPKNFQPLVFVGNADTIANLNRGAGMTEAQQRAQLDVLKQLNQDYQQRHPLESDLAVRLQSFELAYRMQMAAPEALDLAKETETTKKLYGMDQPACAVFGRQCLLARRMVERGVRFVQIFGGTSPGNDGSQADVPWDGHLDIEVNHRGCALSTDQPIAGLLTDLKKRGLLEKTLVIWSGEFGRTADSQGPKGRDHNPHAFTIWMAGGGVKRGIHYGKTDDFGHKAVDNRVCIPDLHATILHLLGLDHTKLTYKFNGRDFRLTDVSGNVVKDILA